MSRVRCHVSVFFVLFFYKMVELFGRGSVINGAYPVDFPDEHIVFIEAAQGDKT